VAIETPLVRQSHRVDPESLTMEPFTIHPVGRLRSALRTPEEAPRQGREGAPDAWLEIDPAFARALDGLSPGDEVIVITWLHRADRRVLEVHPRGDARNPLTGVFATRSPHRPNPLGLHRVTVRKIDGLRLRIGPIEALDDTPVVDLKPVLADSPDA
jgi:tRNA-Thr(GGU) m(6)t(6)A37 methyltransferase TsaA